MVLENNVVLIISQHDAQLDYYGKRLATCSSDRTVKVFDVVDGEPQRSTGGHTLKGCAHAVSGLLLGELMDCKKKNSHTGPVWQVAWAHPKYGHILASCSYDGKVLIWKEQQGQGSAAGGWIKIKEHTLHTASGIWIYRVHRNEFLLITPFPPIFSCKLTLFLGPLMNLVPSLPVRLLTGKFLS